MTDINTDSFYYNQKVKIEIEIEPYKLFLATALLAEILNKGETLRNSLSETGTNQLHEVAELLKNSCALAQANLHKKRGN